MNFVKKNLAINLLQIILVAFLVVVPVLSFAQGDVPAPSETTKLTNPIDAKNLNSLLKTLLEAAVRLGIPIIALAIIYSGFLFVSARGNPEKLKTAKDAFLYTLIGAAILLGSWAIAILISDTVLSL